MSKYFFIAVLVLALGSFDVRADTTVQTGGTDPKQIVTLRASETVYESDELISPYQPINIHLDRMPQSIRMREVYQGAVGEDGPWVDVQGAKNAGPWTDLEAKQDLTIQLDSEKEQNVTWPQTFHCNKAEVIDCSRWRKLYLTCKGKGEGACYTYIGSIELLIQYPGAGQAEKLVVKFPGGC